MARAAVVACVAGLLWASPVRPGVVIGESMAPALHHGQFFLMSRLGARANLARGDIVVFERGRNALIKRVVALPGDIVWAVDWQPLDGRPDLLLGQGHQEIGQMRRFLHRHSCIGRVIHITVPPGHLFVVGDKVQASSDSREFGPIPVASVRGRVIAPASASRR